MSHTVEITVEVHDLEAVKATCRRLKLPQPIHGKVELFSNEVEGTLLRLPDWKYPVAIDLQTGNLRYDNYGGNWGNKAELDRFLMTYGAEKVRLESQKRGHGYLEKELPDGSLMTMVGLGGVDSDKRILTTHLPDGTTRMETTGFQGPTCKAASAFLETTLGEPYKEELTTDYYLEDNEERQEIRQ